MADERPVEIEIEESIGEEIARLRTSLNDWDEKAFRLQGEYDDAVKKNDIETADRIHPRLMQAINAGITVSARIELLREPGELERRVESRLATKRRITALRERRPTVAKETAKEQGFPEVYLNDKGGFKIGMDARAKSDLVLSALGVIDKANPGKALHVFTQTEATKLLTARGWTGFLDRKKELIAQEDQRKAKREQEKEQAARERADAKAAAAKEKADAKAAAKPADTGTSTEGGVKADPKPGKSRSSKAKAAA